MTKIDKVWTPVTYIPVKKMIKRYINRNLAVSATLKKKIKQSK